MHGSRNRRTKYTAATGCYMNKTILCVNREKNAITHPLANSWLRHWWYSEHQTMHIYRRIVLLWKKDCYVRQFGGSSLLAADVLLDTVVKDRLDTEWHVALDERSNARHVFASDEVSIERCLHETLEQIATQQSPSQLHQLQHINTQLVSAYSSCLYHLPQYTLSAALRISKVTHWHFPKFS